MMCRVVWEFKDGSNGGHGSPIPGWLAKPAAERGNKDWPAIHHWIEPVDPVADKIDIGRVKQK